MQLGKGRGKAINPVLWENRERSGHHQPPSLIYCQQIKSIIVYSITRCLAFATFPSYPKSFKKKFWRCWNICFSMQACFNTEGKVNMNKSCYPKFTQLQTINLPPPCELNLVTSATATVRHAPHLKCFTQQIRQVNFYRRAAPKIMVI